MNTLIKILKFLNLTDKDNNLSLTNSALVIVMIKIIISPFDYSGVAILLPVIGSYMHKRFVSNSSKDPVEVQQVDLAPVMEQIKELQDKSEEALEKVNQVALAVGWKKVK